MLEFYKMSNIKEKKIIQHLCVCVGGSLNTKYYICNTILMILVQMIPTSCVYQAGLILYLSHYFRNIVYYANN